MKKSFETIYIDSLETACDGGGGALGHPRVFLHVDDETRQVMCPYCSRTYVLRKQQQAG